MIKIIMYTNLLLALLVLQSCAILGHYQAKEKVSGDFVVELKPVDSYPAYDMSINVIQGIAAFEGGWFTSQTSASKYLLINYLNENGDSEINIRLDMNSHAQDLSLEQISENELHLYTTIGKYDKDGTSGLVRLKVTLPSKVAGKRDMSKLLIEVDREYYLKLRNATPTLSENKSKFAIRSGNTVLVGDKQDVLNEDLRDAIKFDLGKEQLVGEEGENLWFQGIAMKDDLVYCFTGNNSVGSVKLLFVYNLEGEIVKKHKIENNSLVSQLSEKHEPEGITFVSNQLYYTIIVKGKTGRNRNFLYKLDG